MLTGGVPIALQASGGYPAPTRAFRQEPLNSGMADIGRSTCPRSGAAYFTVRLISVF